jgi:FtsP/CotA-like multicopper oxidase with cupredoxin domain
MTPRAQLVSRRSFVAGAAAAAADCGLLPGARAQTASDGFRELRARPLGAGHEAQSATSLLGFDGAVPGPILRVKRGDELRVRLVNELAEPSSVHWHGIRLPNAMDGVPALTQPPVAPGARFEYRFRPPDAGTFWYHAPGGHQLEQGLYGALIVEEAEPVRVDRDIVLVLGTAGPLGGGLPPVRVNGLSRPDIPVTSGERLRLRLVNATAARGLAVKIEGHAVWVMAIDGQPAEPAMARDTRFGLGPGNRIDLFVDMLLDPGSLAPLVAVGSNEPIARLVYAGDAAPRAAPRSDPGALPPNPLPARMDLRSSLKLEMNLASAKALHPADPPMFAVKRGRAVTLTIRNTSGRPHVVHLHGHSFRLLDRLDDGWKPYWLDTLVVGDQVERIAFVADNPGKWPITSRTLEQPGSDAGVWFSVA